MERIAQPMRRNLARLGIDLNLRILDAAQYIERIRQFDYDMIIDGFGASISPGNEQAGYWSSKAAGSNGSRNTTGLKSSAVDSLINGLTQAKTRTDLVTHARALDRVLRAEWLLIPQFHSPIYRIASWNYYSRPTYTPRYGDNIDAWWWNAPVTTNSAEKTH
jgi:microcin C transport system substrate-binding protein